MIDIGKTLKEGREKRRLSIDDVADGTLIRPYYIEEIENNHFPYYDGYITAFIRKYATFLGIDPEPLVLAYKELFKEEPLKPPKKRKNFLWLILLIVVVVSISIVMISYRNNIAHLPEQPEAETPEEQLPPEESEPLPGETEEPEEPHYEGVNLVLRADARCWLGVTIDGNYQQLFIQEGETKEFKGKEYIKIRYGNAKHVYVTKNGQQLGVVSENETVTEAEYRP